MLARANLALALLSDDDEALGGRCNPAQLAARHGFRRPAEAARFLLDLLLPGAGRAGRPGPDRARPLMARAADGDAALRDAARRDPEPRPSISWPDANDPRSTRSRAIPSRRSLPMSLSRRRFLNTSLASSTLVAMGATTVPGFLGRSARAAGAGKPNERILVVVQLLGGNDGLNTVVPHGIDGYNRGPTDAAASARRRSTRSRRRSACTRRWAGWPSCSRRGGWRSSRGSAIPTPTARTSARWRSGRPARLENDAKASRPAGWAAPSTRSGEAGRRSAGPARRRPVAAAGPAQPQEDRGPLAREPRELQAPARRAPTPEKQGRAAGAQRAGGASSAGGRPAAGLHQPDDAVGLRVEQPARAARAEGQAGPKYPNFGLARRLELIAQIIKAGLRHADLLHVARRLRHPRQPARHPRRAADRAVGFDRRVPRRPRRRRPGRPRGRADVQRIRPPGRGERLARHRPRRGRAGVPRRPGRQRRAGRRPPEASTTSTTAT